MNERRKYSEETVPLPLDEPRDLPEPRDDDEHPEDPPPDDEVAALARETGAVAA